MVDGTMGPMGRMGPMAMGLWDEGTSVWGTRGLWDCPLHPCTHRDATVVQELVEYTQSQASRLRHLLNRTTHLPPAHCALRHRRTLHPCTHRDAIVVQELVEYTQSQASRLRHLLNRTTHHAPRTAPSAHPAPCPLYLPSRILPNLS